jgi:hypothetical protein
MPWVITGYDDDGEPLVEWVDEPETETPVTEVVLPDLRTADLRPGDPYYTGPELPDLSGIPSGIFTGGESQDHDFTKEEADALWKAGVWDQVKGLSQKALDLFKTNGEYDLKKLMVFGGGLLAASKPNNAAPTGYQGKIPKLTATSNMLTAPPVGRRPGSGGINYGGGVTYRDEAGNVVSSNEKTLEELRQAAINNPFNRGATYERQQGGLGRSDLVALLNQLNPSGGGYTPPPPKKDTSGFVTGAGDTGERFDPFKPSLPEGTTMSMDPSTRVGNTVTTDGITRGYDPLRGTMFTNAEMQARADKELADRQARREAMRNGTYVEPEYSQSSQNTAPISQGTPGFVAPIYNAAILPPKNQPYVNPHASSLASPATIPLMSGESQEQGAARLQAQSDALEQRRAAKAAMRANMGSDGVAVGMAAGGLAPEGFVVPADVVSHLGNGSSEAGLKLLVANLGAEPIKGEGDGMSDSIPTTIGGKQEARVANDEAFISPEMVKRIGGGDAEKGAKKLYAMMDRVREERTGTKEQGKQIDPNKFMPGGSVQKYQTGGTTVPKTTPAGATGVESSLSNWGGDYVTNMLGQGAALANKPYEAYTGPLTAGASGLQDQAFGIAAGLKTPASIGKAATTAGGIASLAPDAGKYTPVGIDFDADQAQQYMNPYVQSALGPALDEARREADISRVADAGRLTKAGAYGGSRQAIMESEGRRNLMDKLNQMLTSGYSTAFDKAQQQFNADQARKIQEQQFGTTSELQGLQTGIQGAQAQGQLGALESQTGIAGLNALTSLGGVQRGIESEGIAADKAQFEEARLNPYKMVQFQQSLLSGLPLDAQSYSIPSTSNLQQFSKGADTVYTTLKKLGVIN